MFSFEELDEETRRWMLIEFQDEENSGKPYRSPRLSEIGLANYPDIMEKAISNGNEEYLKEALSQQEYWNSAESSHKGLKVYSKTINYEKAAKSLAYSEFNTWYVRGLARRLIEEGVDKCQVYRAAIAEEPRTECLQHENEIYSVKEIYAGHRARYWGDSINPTAFSIPVGPNCHHSIRRVR
jgi:hypothetical protein